VWSREPLWWLLLEQVQPAVRISALSDAGSYSCRADGEEQRSGGLRNWRTATAVANPVASVAAASAVDLGDRMKLALVASGAEVVKVALVEA
jgi:hypothetical protein